MMEDRWKQLVLQWTNCFFPKDILRSIHDMRQENFMPVFTSESVPTNVDPFAQLLKYLRNLYPKYEFLDPGNKCWSEENELLLLAMLMLLHASIFQPCESLRQRANKTLCESSQLTIVKFLEKAMSFGPTITKEDLMQSIPPVPNSDLPKNQILSPISPVPSHLSPVVKTSGTTPLADFFSSPVARRSQRGHEGRYRDKIANLQMELENELMEKEELKKNYEKRINELTKQVEEKCMEARMLKEYVANSEEIAELSTETPSIEQLDRSKLRDEVKDLKQYICRLEGDVEDLHNSKEDLQRKLSYLEKKASELESRAVISESDCATLRQEVKQQALVNESLRARCHELESSVDCCLSPSRPSLSGASNKLYVESPTCTPENLGPIIETQLIEREKENEELRFENSELEKRVSALQSSFEELQDTYFREKESAARVKTKLESQIVELNNTIGKISEELKVNSAEKDKLLASLKDVEGKFETSTLLLRDVTSARDAAASQFHSVSEEKHALEVKVALLKAKIQIAEESREGLNETLSHRSSEIVALKEERETLLAQVRSVVRERDKMEQTLNDVIKKRDHLQRVSHKIEVEKEGLEETVSALKEQCNVKEQLLEDLDKLSKELQQQLLTVSQEKESVHLQLQSVVGERDTLSASCTALTNQNNVALAQVVTLTDEKVKMEALLQDAIQQRDDAYITSSKLSEERNKIKDQLEQAMAENDRLSCELSIITQQESDLDNELKELHKQKVSLEKHLTAASQEIQKQEAALKNSDTKISEMLLEKDNLCTKYNEEISKLSAEVQQLHGSSNILSHEKKNLQLELEALHGANTKLNQQVEEIHQNLTTSQSEAMFLRSKLDAANRQCEELNAIICELTAEKSNIEGDLSDHVSRLRVAVQENASLKKEVELLSGKLSDLSDEKLNVEQIMENERSKCMALSEEKAVLLAELKNVAEEKNGMQSQLNMLNETRSEVVSKLNYLKERDSELTSQITTLSSQLQSAMKERENLKESFEAHRQVLQDELEEKSEQWSSLFHDYSQLESNFATLKREKDVQDGELKILLDCKTALENELACSISKLEDALLEKNNACCEYRKALKEKEEALLWVETSETELKSTRSQLEIEHKLKEESLALLKSNEAVLSQLNASSSEKENLITNLTNRLTEFEEKQKEMHSEFECVQKEKENLESDLLKMNSQLNTVLSELQELKERLKAKDKEILNLNEQLKTTQKDETINCLESKLELAEKEKTAIMKELTETRNSLQSLQSSLNLKDEALALLCKEKEDLKCQLEQAINISQTSKTPKLFQEDQVSTTGCIEKLNIINEEASMERNKTISSFQEELEVRKEYERDNNISKEHFNDGDKSLSQMQQLEDLKKQLKEEKNKVLTMEIEMKTERGNMEQKLADLRQQLASARGQDKLAQLQQDEYFWQFNRAKNHLECRLDGMMSQKDEVEEHLSELRVILDDVGLVCDNLYSALPANCDAVYEVTNMKKEVENKLRAVDKKYADSLCGIIKASYNIRKWIEKQAKMPQCEGNPIDSVFFFSEKDTIEGSIIAVCDVMTSLVMDVRAVMNSCKFLSERCESYLKAQTRESLLIKTSNKEFLNVHNSAKVDTKEETVCTPSPNTVDLKVSWFGNSCTLAEGYSLLKESHASLEKQLNDLHIQLKEMKQQQSHQDHAQVIAKLQAKINALMMRPSQEQIDEKVRELHTMYAEKLETMKSKMKQVVNEEVQKVEQEKAKSEKEIVVKYNKRICEFEEHIKALSSQLWELGEKLLQEEQDHRSTKAQLASLKERQLQYITSNQHRTKSLDRLDLLMPGGENPSLILMSKRDVLNQSTQTAQNQSRAQSFSSLPRDMGNNDEISSRHSTKMAPASMGLAFPEEDEDGEVFNNDYLTELKEGRCRPSADNRRLSELQFRNSLCPPHLKSSYPLETQFHDPKVYREEELKGQDDKLRRPSKDRGTTSYKKPGPPTPSRKAGRLSLQGKEDLTPRAVLREHNDSQSSYGSGMLRVAKTTPSRLKALFTSSKVANASNLQSKRDENSTPGTPSSKRLSIFRRRFGSTKDSHSLSSGYSSFR